MNLDYNKKTNLCFIMENFGSDKSTLHNYTVFYNFLFNDIKQEVKNVFELGLGWQPNSGASHRGWREYFNNANIYGAEIDSNVLFTEERIHTFYCDQTNKSDIDNLWSNKDLLNIELDIIIDDGYHNYNANIIFFENSFRKLKKNGYYIIEDILNDEIFLFEEYLAQNNYNHFFVKQQSSYKPLDNNLLIFKK